MVTLNKIAHQRLLLQAEEAEERGLHQLSTGILSMIKAAAEDSKEEYSYEDMSAEIYQGLWELASKVAKYYDVENIEAEKLDEVIETLAEDLISQVEEAMQVESNQVGPFESKVPGETK